ncbi:MAG: hypothetical protein ACKVIX_06705 [Sphingomonadales bacterium]
MNNIIWGLKVMILKTIKVLIAISFGTLGLTTSANALQAHAHIGHVVKGFGNTPDNMGMLHTSQAEAKVALDHSGFAISDLSNLASIKMHSRHLMHALNPSHIEGGPGLGYGMDKAVKGIIQHIELAAKSKDASDSLKMHAVHIKTSSRNVMKWSSEAMSLIHGILGMDNLKTAGESATKVNELMVSIMMGHDANGDGKIGWHEGEGGLAQASLHAKILSKNEGVN